MTSSQQMDSIENANERRSDDFTYFSPWPDVRPTPRATRALSCNEDRPPAPNPNPNRLKSFCSTIKRRLSISKEYRSRSGEINRSLSTRLNNYKSFSSTIDEPVEDFQWPDFERIYDTIPPCLANALPGLDDITFGDDDDDEGKNEPAEHDETLRDWNLDESVHEIHRFESCKRGRFFRRNAVCEKLDKTLHHGQLDTFIQQLMVEKLLRTWT